MSRAPRRARWLVTLLAALAPAAHADDELRILVLRLSLDAIQKARHERNADDLKAAVEAVLDDPARVALATSANLADVRFIVEANRLDKQVGSSNTGPGTTSLVASGSVPRLLGLAIEAGALTQTVSGTTLTFRTNPAGLATALTRAGFTPGSTDQATQNTLAALRRINLGLTFDTAREKDGRFTGSYRQLQQFSTQIYLYNRRDPTHPAWAKVWTGFAARAGTALANAARDLAMAMRTDAFKAAREETRAKLLDMSTSDAASERLILDYVSKVQALIPEREQAGVIAAWKGYLTAQTAEYSRIARSPILTLEYELNRPPIQDAPADAAVAVATRGHPDLSTTRLVFVRPFLGSSDMTLNASLSCFNQTRPEMRGNIRDFQFGGKLDFLLNGVFGLSKAQFTVAGLYMRLRQSPVGLPVTINGVDVEQRGNLAFAQARLRIPMGDSGFSVPFSVTYANRTELIKEAEMRANVGLTFDLDKLIKK